MSRTQLHLHSDRCVHCGLTKALHIDDICPIGRVGSRYSTMNLPDGKQCNDCVHVVRCCGIFSCIPGDEVCDFFPIRFQERTSPLEVV